MSNIFGLDALTALAVAGSQVPGIELGTAVVPAYPRHPAVLAQQALTAALAAGPGRLTLGIGLSHKIVIEDMYGYSFDRPARYMREYLSVLLPLLDGTAVSVDGSMLSAHIGLSVPRAGRVPVLLAAMAPRMLNLAGEQAGGTVLWMTGPATVRDYVVPAISAAASRQPSAPPARAFGLPPATSPHRLRDRTARITSSHSTDDHLAVTSWDGTMVTGNGTAARYSSPPMT